MRELKRELSACLLGVVLCAPVASAQTVFRGEMPFSGDFFGRALAIDGDLAVVGAPYDDTIAQEAGAAYVYENTGSGWVLLHKFLGAQIGDQFGFSVAVVRDESGLNEGDFIAVGSLFGDGAASNSGNVSMYRRMPMAPGFVFQHIVAAGDGSGFDEFGYSVALDLSVPSESLSGDPVYTLLVGAPDDNGAQGQDMGALYVYQSDPTGITWGGIAKLVPDDIVGGDLLGRDLDVSGDFGIVGATGWGFGNHPEGVAYLVRRFFDTGAGFFNWEISNRLTATDGEPGDRFGAGVAIDAGVAVVGAPGAGPGNSIDGAVYIFGGVPAGYDVSESQRLSAPVSTDGSSFGTQVDVDGRVMVASEAANMASGRVHVFRSPLVNDWTWLETLTVANPPGNSLGASALAFSLPLAFASDPLQTGGGAAYLLTNQRIFNASFE